MKKKLAVGILSVALLTGGATAALAADSTTINDLKALYQQKFVLQEQYLQEQVTAGVYTQEQADAMKVTFEAREQARLDNLDNGIVVGGKNQGGQGGAMGLNNGQALTQEQIDQRDALRAERQQLRDEAIANGTLVPGQGYGQGNGNGGSGNGHQGGQF